MLALGLMSGTSLDGIDAAVVRITPRDATYDIELLTFVTVPFSESLARSLRAVLAPNAASGAAIADLNRDLGFAFAHAGRVATGALALDFVASHGQTVYHDGKRHVTLQLGDPFVLRESLNATVCFDFRSADCAVGGHGAPLVPYVDALLLGSADEDRVAVNIGGIANLTALPGGSAVNDVAGFDCGPGVMLIDALVAQRTSGTMAMDADGAFACRGTVDEALLARMLADPYFSEPPPKSTGRERFGTVFFDAHPELADLSLQDAAATLTELTARAIARAVELVGLPHARILCSGGGARNPALLGRLAGVLPDASIETTDTLGIPVDAKEAIAFAVLGYETLRERAANVPRVTGASRAVPLGAIAPRGLRRLLDEIEIECRSS